MSEGLEFKLLGKDYRVACKPAERDSLTQAVALLEARLKEAGSSKAGANIEKIALMVALNLAHELVVQQGSSEEQKALLESEKIRRMINSIESRLDDSLAKLSATA